MALGTHPSSQDTPGPLSLGTQHTPQSHTMPPPQHRPSPWDTPVPLSVGTHPLPW